MSNQEPKAVKLAGEPVLEFRLGSLWLAIDAGFVEEICVQEEPIAIPRVPAYIPGFMSLRGHAVPLLDLGSFLGLERDAPLMGRVRVDAEIRGRVVVISVGEMQVGLMCDQVRGFVEINASSLKEPELSQAGRLAEFALGVLDDHQGFTVVVDVPGLLEAARVQG